MGGLGSGSYYRWQGKSTVEECRRLDVNWLNNRGYLVQGAMSSVRWTRDGEYSGSIGIRAEASGLLLEYRSRSGARKWENVTEYVPLSWTACNYGGWRPWFICPGASCGRRVGKLYSAGRYFLCRHCYGLAYASQRENTSGRMLMKAQNIRRRLGSSTSMVEPFPDKPKGMHWRTYMRLQNEHDKADYRSWIATAAWLERLSAKSLSRQVADGRRGRRQT